MITIVFAAFDKKIVTYLQPFHVSHEAVALRSFKDACNNPESAVCRTPEDFALYRLGTFDDQTGKFSMEEPQPRVVAEALQFKQKGAA